MLRISRVSHSVRQRAEPCPSVSCILAHVGLSTPPTISTVSPAAGERRSVRRAGSLRTPRHQCGFQAWEARGSLRPNRELPPAGCWARGGQGVLVLAVATARVDPSVQEALVGEAPPRGPRLGSGSDSDRARAATLERSGCGLCCLPWHREGLRRWIPSGWSCPPAQRWLQCWHQFRSVCSCARQFAVALPH